MRMRISGGLLIDPSQTLEAVRDVLIEGNHIVAILPHAAGKRKPSPKERVIDAKGKWVMPGMIDMHVHLREPGRESEEDIASGTRAAAQGGVTTVLAMPNTRPPIDTATMARFVQKRAHATGKVNVLVAGAITKGQRGAELVEMGRMASAGAVAFTDDGNPVMNAQVMRRALECAKRFGVPILDHSEDKDLSCDGVINEGPVSVAKGLQGIPAAAEAVMAMRDITLAELTGGRLHLCHVSCGDTVDVVRSAKQRGVRVTAETAPHYFTLSDADIPDDDADFKMNPPLRSGADVKRILRALTDGTLDAVATDHAPHGAHRKSLGLARAPFGIIGLETLLPLTLRLVHRRIIDKKRMVQLLSTGPASILGLQSKGGLKPGMDADVTIVDPTTSHTVRAKSQSKSRNTPFKGWKLQGKAVTVIVGGRLVMEQGRLL